MTKEMTPAQWEDFSVNTHMRWTRDVASADEMRAGIRRWVSRGGDVITVLSEVK